ncbi:MAG: N-6 DNA methylase, partial [Oscillibacter sp.]|nr:N-6 DNA methylase [Oscillibacter sp.]
CTKTAYDMAMGTSQMLGCLDERLKSIHPQAELACFGQEFNPETYAIAKADMLIKGGNAERMKYGDTLSDDQFSGYEFDYIISNPPFGIDWKREKADVEAEKKKGYDGRFGPGLPAISDGQMLFMLNGVKKLKSGSGRMAIIQNGSSLFTGDAGSGASEIRRYVIVEDLVEAIVQLPNDLFYNTGITTYIWLLSKGKTDRAGKIQLIDASRCFVKRRKNIGSKRVDLTDECLDLILRAYDAFTDGVYEDGELRVESRVYDNDFFGYTKVTVLVPELDADGNPVMKHGKPVQDKSVKPDTEIIPLTEDVDAYMEKNVLPYNPHAYLDRSKDKIGYEIPFTRLFYKFTPPTPSEQVRREIEELDAQEAELMRELFGEE